MGVSARGRCFVHAADLHLDTPFAGMEAGTPQMAELLRDASLDALDRLVEVALDREAAFVVLAGDIYDGSERGLRAQLRFRDALARLDDAGIPTFVVHGNHDPIEEGWQAIRTWPPAVTVFGEDEVGAVPVHADGQRIATIHGISYATRAVTENLAARFERTAAPGVHVGLLHATVGSQPEHAPYAPCTIDDLRAARMDYWALGHVHRRQVLRRGEERGDAWVVYAGNTQARSLKPSERGAKGCYVVPFDPDADASPIGEPEFVPLDAVRFEEPVVEIDDVEELPELADRLLAAGDQARDEADGRALVLRARLAGRGPLHHELARPGVHDELLQRLRDAVRDLQPAMWWDALKVATRPVLDRDALRERADFTGELVRLVDQLRKDPEVGGLSGDVDEILERLEPPPEAAPLGELLTEAEARALDLLSEEG
jgi:DNA repair protein SbcD/Mre11